MKFPVKQNAGLTVENAGVYRTWADYQGLDIFIGDVTRKSPLNAPYISREMSGFQYTFGKDGLPRYYLFNCKVTDPFFDILTTEGGTFDEPQKSKTYPIGFGSLDLEGEQPIFRYDTKEHGRGSWLLQRSGPPVINHSGVYYDPALTGSGLSIKQYQVNWSTDPIATCYWYTYDRAGRQHWFLCAGHPNDMKIYRYADGKFSYMGAQEIEIGAAVLDLDNKLFHYDFYALGIKAKGHMELTRLI